jgi:hypothetical protein
MSWQYETDAPKSDLQEVRHWTAKPCPFWLTMFFILFPPLCLVGLIILGAQ